MKNTLPEKYKKYKNFGTSYDGALTLLAQSCVVNPDFLEREFIAIYSNPGEGYVVFLVDRLCEYAGKRLTCLDLSSICDFQPVMISSSRATAEELKRMADGVEITLTDGRKETFRFDGHRTGSKDAFEVINLLRILKRRLRPS